ncbi:putative bifunctional diguanylate cyclase/phosphodiesterase [Paraburkholderia sp. 32]|uniref:putative bifunctional diguanylate cyclase/phosphodiesterase n=1 Tax=Paraburkholderia sp. 32 TaxID=2991057 RepID=UPI003D25FAF8
MLRLSVGQPAIGAVEAASADTQQGSRLHFNRTDEMSSVASATQESSGLQRVFAASGDLTEATADVGVAGYHASSAAISKLAQTTSAAQRRAEDARGSEYRTSNSTDPTLRRRFRGQLNEAIEKQEFVLHYQPKYDLRLDKITGVEALIRWQHPEQGLIAPGGFIQVAERSGLIVPIGDWVLNTACKQLAEWRRDGLHLKTMAINLSPVQLAQKNFVEIVVDAISRNGLNPSDIELELTEGILLGEEDATVLTLHRLSDAGVKLSLDDFGTGYSSLSYLRWLPVDRLKIERSFVRDLEENGNVEAIVKTIIQLSQNLNLLVTAEGVETKTQMHMLERLGCDEIQGFLISRAVSPAEVASLLEQQLL